MLTSRSRRREGCLAILIVFLFSSTGTVYSSEKVISLQQAELIGELIFQNECAGKDANLLHWNDGENFPSLGIGHFIWYPAHYNGSFDESFPKLLIFLQGRGIALPDWFQTLPGLHAPWRAKGDFLRALEKGELDSLKTFLMETKSEQAVFLVERFNQSISKILEAVPLGCRQPILQKLFLMLKANDGLYPLIDYVNFNGEGILESERYNGEGWGLLQVLETMRVPAEESNVVPEFVKAVERILERRVSNSPPERNEKRWLPGWKIRIYTYLTVQDPTKPVEAQPLQEILLSTVAANIQLTENANLPVDDVIPPPTIAR
ncbi:MAG TPA: hypothetical protein PLO78_09835 [Candidatus Omnitrophota bacterium]|nr:hypothetical protein [Candidatus Omnitrophota bacterium]